MADSRINVRGPGKRGRGRRRTDYSSYMLRHCSLRALTAMTSLQQITMVARRRGGGSGGEDQRQDRMGCNGRAREGLGDAWGGTVAVTSCPSRQRFVFLAPYCHCACLRQKEGQPSVRRHGVSGSSGGGGGGLLQKRACMTVYRENKGP